MNFVGNILKAQKNLYQNFIETLRFQKHSLYKYMALSAFESSVTFANQHLKGARRFHRRKDLIHFCLEKALTSQISEGIYAEFGVFQAKSLKMISDYISKTKNVVYGFDCFEGLPGDWGTILPQGAFAIKKLPKVPHNAVLVKGLFTDTLPTFIKEHCNPFSFIHIDCDLYQSTKDIFDLIKHQIVPGTIILFDEYINVVDWENHEYLAFREFAEKNNVQFEYLAYHSEQTLGSGTEVAIVIK